jgi:hypothetical protein
MTGSNDKSALLQWSVFITKRPGLNRELPPGYESLAWVPNSSTLIYGEQFSSTARFPFADDPPRDFWASATGGGHHHY